MPEPLKQEPEKEDVAPQPVELDHDSRRDEGTFGQRSGAQLQIGSRKQMFSARSGSVEAQKKTQELMDVGDADRAQKIHDILKLGVGNAHTFDFVTVWLMGNNAKLRTEYQKLANRPLEADIINCFGKGDHKAHTGSWKTQYLLDVTENGFPSTFSKVALALGLVSGTRGDGKEVVRLVEGAPAATQVEILNKLFDPLFDTLVTIGLDTSMLDRLIASTKAAQSEVARDKAKQADPNSKKTTAAEAKLCEAKAAHLVSIVKTHRGTVYGIDLKAVAAELKEWADKEPSEVRHAVTADGSAFVKYLDSWKSAKRGVGKVSGADVTYLVELVRDHAAIPMELVDDQQPEQDQAQNGQQAQAPSDKEKEQQKESNEKVRELHAYADRKAEKNYKLKVQDWTKLKGQIEGMSDKEREAFLATYLPVDAQARWNDPAVRGMLRPLALQSFEAKLKEMGIHGKSRAEILARFDKEAIDGQLDKGSVYQQIRSLLYSKKVHLTSTYMDLLVQANGNDYYNIRRDPALLNDLKGLFKWRVGGSEAMKRVETLLGINEHDESEKRIDDLGGRDKHEAAHDAADNAELRPEHWSIVLAVALDGNSATRASGAVTKAYLAAQRCAALPDGGVKGAVGMGAKPVQKMDVATFMEKVEQGLPGDAKKTLKKGNYATARKALEERRMPTVDERLKDAEYHGMRTARRASGNDAKGSSAEAAFMDLSGKALLDEWSNIGEFHRLSGTQMGLRDKIQQGKASPQDQQRYEAANRGVRDFILDVREDRLAWLNGHIKQADLVPLLKDLRGKLRSAAANDTEFRQSLEAAYMPMDEYQLARMKGLSQLDEQRNKDSGKQWNSFMGIGVSSKSKQRKEARNELLGEFRSAQHELREVEGQDGEKQKEAREKVNNEHVPKIEDKQEELERRTEAHDALRAKAKMIVNIAVGIILGIVATAIGAAVTAATWGTASAVWIGILVSMAIALGAGTVKALVAKSLDGDNFNARQTVIQIAWSVLMAGAAGGLGVAHHALSGQLGLLGASDILHGGPEVFQAIFKDAGIKLLFENFCADSINFAGQQAMSEESNRWARFGEATNMALGWVRSFALDVGGDLAKDAALQSAGLYRVDEGSDGKKFGRDSDGNKIVHDQNDNVAKGLDTTQTWEKRGVETGMGLGMKPIDIGSNKGVGALSDKVKALGQRPEVSETPLKDRMQAKKSEKPEPQGGVQDAQPENVAPQVDPKQEATERAKLALQEDIRRARVMAATATEGALRARAAGERAISEKARRVAIELRNQATSAEALIELAARQPVEASSFEGRSAAIQSELSKAMIATNEAILASIERGESNEAQETESDEARA